MCRGVYCVTSFLKKRSGVLCSCLYSSQLKMSGSFLKSEQQSENKNNEIAGAIDQTEIWLCGRDFNKED